MAEETPRPSRRAAGLGAGVALAVFVACLVGLGVAFPPPRGLLAGFVALDRQAWLIVAASLAAGLGLGSLVQARLATTKR